MGKKISDRNKKKIIADYVGGESMRALARKYDVAPSTVKRIIDNDPEMKQKATQKKEEDETAILKYMDRKKEVVCEVIDKYLQVLTDPDKLKKASVRDIAVALGVVIDKFSNTSSDNETGKLEDLIKGIKGI